MDVGTKIKKYLSDTGVSQAFVSKKSGIPASKLNQSLNGKRRLTLSEYESICGALGVEVGMFISPSPPITRRQ